MMTKKNRLILDLRGLSMCVCVCVCLLGGPVTGQRERENNNKSTEGGWKKENNARIGN